MTLVRWSPFREMEAMQSEMNRLFSRFGGYGAFERDVTYHGQSNGAQNGSAQNGSAQSNSAQSSEQSGARSREIQWVLPVDVIETADAFRLRASLPGISPEDVQIEFNDNVLTIAAQRHQEDTVEDGSYRWIEQQYGTFSRSLTMPRFVDADKIEARYNNGLLELTVPKKENTKPRRIALQTGTNEPRTLDGILEASQSSQESPKQLQN